MIETLRGLRLHQVVEAWRVRPVRIGLAGTLLITVGSLTPAYLPRTSVWWPAIRSLQLDTTWFRLVGTVITLGGLALLVSAWFSLRPPASHDPRRGGPASEQTGSDTSGEGGSDQAGSDEAGRSSAAEGSTSVYLEVRHWAVLAIWGLPFLLAPPIFSHDAYSYAAQGWLIHNHINPYEAGPGVLPGSFADQVAWVWRYTPAPYGPLSLQIQHLIVVLAGFDPYFSAVLMRVPALIGVALIGMLLPRVAKALGADPAFSAWFGTLNPILVIDFIGGAHNDALMLGLVVLAIYVSTLRPWTWWLGVVIVGVAAAIKQPAFLAAYALPFVAHPWRGWRWRDSGPALGRVAAAVVMSVGTFIVISWATGLGFGWYNAIGVPGLVVTVSPFTVLGQVIQLWMNQAGIQGAGVVVRYSRTVGLIASLVLVLVLALTRGRRQPITFLSWSYLAVAFFGPALHSWYVLWGGVLLPLTRPSERIVRVAVWATLFLLSYSAVILSWRNGAVALGIAALVGYLWLTWTHHRSQPALEEPESLQVAP